MPLDINAFRSIAGQSPDKFIYAQGETLKASRSETRHGAHTYRAATNAFLKAERDRLADELVDLPAGQEFDVKNARLQEIDQQILQSEKQQTDTLSDQQIVDLVENAIRSRPQDFPLLTRYYLGVHQNGGRQGARAEG